MRSSSRHEAKSRYCGSCWMRCNINGMIQPGYMLVNGKPNQTEMECPKLSEKIRLEK